jgi:hypothetical protein
MARKPHTRDHHDSPAADEGVRPAEDPAAIITNVWTLTSQSAEQIGKEVTGETTEAPPPALRALFRANGRR